MGFVVEGIDGPEALIAHIDWTDEIAGGYLTIARGLRPSSGSELCCGAGVVVTPID
jgi:hypothetical protein